MFDTHEGIICKTEESRMIGIKTAFLSSIVRLLNQGFVLYQSSKIHTGTKVKFLLKNWTFIENLPKH